MLTSSIKSMNRFFYRFFTTVTIIYSLTEANAQIKRNETFRSQYQLKKVVVLSRHNIRSPLSGPESALGRITPHQWFAWTSAPGELSLRGGVLETEMGQFFRKWLVSEGLMQENELPAEGNTRQAVIYDMQGRRLNNIPQRPGIYIKDRQKVILK